MVEQNTDADLDRAFKALADPARRMVLQRLQSGPASIGDLASPLDMSFAGAAKHIAVLVEAGLVEKQKVGRQQICRLNPDAMRQAYNWMHRYAAFWTDHLHKLEQAVRRYENE